MSTEILRRLDKALGRMEVTADPSEFHGMLVGLICANGELAREQWLAQTLPADEPGRPQDALGTLSELYSETVRQMRSTLMDFQPLLPDDDDPLVERVDALSEWCQGFLAGLAMGGIDAPEKLPGDVGEVMQDLVEITRASGYEFAEDEDDENAYGELVEYVRTGVLLVNEELNPTKAPPIMNEDKTIH